MNKTIPIQPPPRPDKLQSASEVTDNETALFPTLSMDWKEFAYFLEGSDLSDDQKREFIETMWNIVVAFVDLGFGIHPVQQATSDANPDACVQNRDLIDFITAESGDLLKSNSCSKTQFDHASLGSPNSSSERSQK